MPDTITLSTKIDKFLTETPLDSGEQTTLRTSLGLGALSTVTPGTNVATALAVNAVGTGGVLLGNQAVSTTSNVAFGTVTATTPIALTSGGTGGSTASAARTSLKVPASDITGITGAGVVSNIITLTPADYATLVAASGTVATTLYIVT